MKKSAKTPAETAVETRYVLAPHMVNALGTAFGGVIMSWIDVVAAMVAQRHCEGIVVTASVDTMSFLDPIYIGDHVILKASVNYVGRTSMEIGIRVTAENLQTGEIRHTNTSYATMVAIDENGKPTPVPELKLNNDTEKRRFKEAELRKALRKEYQEKHGEIKLKD